MLNAVNPNISALTGLLPEEIAHQCVLSPSFRARQIFLRIAKGALSYDQMLELPQQLRADLQSQPLTCTRLAQQLLDPDGTIKLAIELFDGLRVETVLLIDKNNRKTACVSCQVGCPMKCAFCQTGQLGFTRNLTVAEITEQFFHLERIAGKLDNIVFMGMGEPLLNLAAIKKAVRILSHPQGRALSTRRITVSTSGLCKGMYEFADTFSEVRLAVSLTVANEQLRTDLMPVTKNNSLDQLKKAIAYVNAKTKKRVTLELALLSGVNTSKKSAAEVIRFAEGLNVHLNLIAWNPVENLPFKTPRDAEVKAFAQYLQAARLSVTVRRKRGRKIGGACGQLGKV